jgi:hypothetical protein
LPDRFSAEEADSFPLSESRFIDGKVEPAFRLSFPVIPSEAEESLSRSAVFIAAYERQFALA